MSFINGQWRVGSGVEFVSTNPATGDIVWTGQAASQRDVDLALRSAQSAVANWSAQPLSEREAILRKFAELLRDSQDHLTRTISTETGKPLWDARSEVEAMIGKVDISLRSLHERRADTQVALTGNVTGRVQYRPHGVVAVFGPFNFPGHLANGQIVPALATGNCVILKPSELTPLVAEETVKLWEAAGLPPGVLNLLQGARETGEAIVQHPTLNALLFTGSYRTAVSLQRMLVDRPEVLLALELGGNNPLIVHQVTNVDAAVAITLQSAFITSGQRCTCARRLLVTPGNEAFLAKLAAAIPKLRIDHPLATPQPFLGPLIHAAAAEAVLAAQQRLIDGGAIPLVPAQRLDKLGPAFVSPGLLDVTNCSSVSDEEIFGPLLQLQHVTSLKEACNAANATRYGLVAGLLSEDESAFELFSRTVRAGLLNWNRPTTGASGLLPFGGIGRSGNHRPAGYFTVDACNIPVAIQEQSQLVLGQLPPGVDLS